MIIIKYVVDAILIIVLTNRICNEQFHRKKKNFFILIKQIEQLIIIKRKRKDI